VLMEFTRLPLPALVPNRPKSFNEKMKYDEYDASKEFSVDNELETASGTDFKIIMDESRPRKISPAGVGRNVARSVMTPGRYKNENSKIFCFNSLFCDASGRDLGPPSSLQFVRHEDYEKVYVELHKRYAVWEADRLEKDNTKLNDENKRMKSEDKKLEDENDALKSTITQLEVTIS
ncbi:Unknown protein, partial [Striga hermonthica]